MLVHILYPLLLGFPSLPKYSLTSACAFSIILGFLIISAIVHVMVADDVSFLATPKDVLQVKKN